MIDCRLHPGQPLFSCRLCYDDNFRPEWRAASGAGVKRDWWVCRDADWNEIISGREKTIGAYDKSGAVRKFKTRGAAQKLADELNKTQPYPLGPGLKFWSRLKDVRVELVMEDENTNFPVRRIRLWQGEKMTHEWSGLTVPGSVVRLFFAIERAKELSK